MIRMIFGVLEALLAISILLLFILFISNYPALSGLANIASRYLAPLLIPYLLVWMLLKRLPKALMFLSVMLTLAALYLVQLPVPLIGSAVKKGLSGIRRAINPSKISEDILKVRGSMVRIATENANDEPRFSDEDPYRGELRRIKRTGVKRLELGETAMSLTLGIILIINQLNGVSLFESRVSTLFVEIYLIVLAVAIVYGTTVIDLLSYDGTEEFESLNEMETALGYQKGITTHDIFQWLFVMIGVAVVIAEDKFELAEPIIEKREREDLSLTETIPDLLSATFGNSKDEE